MTTNALCAEDGQKNAPDGTLQREPAVLLPKAASPMTIITENKCSMASLEGNNETFPAALLFLAPLITKAGEKLTGALVGAAYDKFTTWLANRKAELTASTTAVASTVFYSPDGHTPSFRCIQLVRGDLMQGRFNEAAYNVERYPAAVTDIWSSKQLQTKFKTWQLSTPPELYMALQLQLASARDPNGGNDEVPLYVKLKPLEILYLKSGAKRNSGDGKQVIVQVSISDLNGKPLVSETFDLGTIQVGKTYSLRFLDGRFVPLPTPTSLTVPSRPQGRSGVQKSASNASSDSTTSVDSVSDPIPITIAATITETEEGGDFARSVATTLADNGTRKAIVDAAASEAAGQIENLIKRGQPTTAR
jgi:hypothetical protein